MSQKEKRSVFDCGFLIDVEWRKEGEGVPIRFVFRKFLECFFFLGPVSQGFGSFPISSYMPVVLLHFSFTLSMTAPALIIANHGRSA